MIKNEKFIFHIIIPFYNSKKTLSNCLNSLKNYSNYKDQLKIKFIFVDDGSTDGSEDIINNFNFGGDLILIKLKKNMGVAYARNIALKKIKHSDFIFFLDSDDEVSENLFKYFKRLFCKEGIGVAQERYFYNGEYKETSLYFKEDRIINKKDIVKYTINYLIKPNEFSMLSYCWGKIYDFNIIKNNNISFDESLSAFEDAKFNFAYLLFCKKIKFSTLVIYRYNISPPTQTLSYSLTKSISSYFGFLDSLDQTEKFLIHFFKDDKKIERKIKSKVLHSTAAFTCISLVRQCYRWRSLLDCLLSYPKILNDLFLRFNLKKSFYHYNFKKANGSLTLTFFLQHKLWFFASFLLYFKYKKDIYYRTSFFKMFLKILKGNRIN